MNLNPIKYVSNSRNTTPAKNNLGFAATIRCDEKLLEQIKLTDPVNHKALVRTMDALEGRFPSDDNFSIFLEKGKVGAFLKRYDQGLKDTFAVEGKLKVDKEKFCHSREPSIASLLLHLLDNATETMEDKMDAGVRLVKGAPFLQ